MLKEYTHIEWNRLKMKIKETYPSLNESDLEWRDGTTKDLLWMISLKLKKPRKELMEVIEKLDKSLW